jgi:transcriptional regulator with XRE-family HTH domain
MFTESNFMGFGWVVSGIIFIVIVSSLGSQSVENQPFKYDAILGDRMKQLGMTRWKELAQKANLSSLRLRQIRSGAIATISRGELSQLAQALNWSIQELENQLDLLPNPHLIPPPPADLPPGLETELRQQCQRLREELEQQNIQLQDAFQQSTFEQLHSLLTNYPTATELARSKPDLPAKNLIALFAPLDNLLASWGYEPIGIPWEAVPYQPQFHQPDSDEIQPGDLVYIRFVGYRQGDRILSPAKVSRTLPSGILPSS